LYRAKQQLATRANFPTENYFLSLSSQQLAYMNSFRNCIDLVLKLLENVWVSRKLSINKTIESIINFVLSISDTPLVFITTEHFIVPILFYDKTYPHWSLRAKVTLLVNNRLRIWNTSLLNSKVHPLIGRLFCKPPCEKNIHLWQINS
jgi:hypothetical protein